jgi:predicted  nucleic acid-binding Zn-ribbon protein
MNTIESVVLLADVDAMIREAQSSESRMRLRKLGFELEGLPRVMAARERLAETIDRRWTISYERTRQRYGRAVAAVRERVCSGCFVTLPTTARPKGGDAPTPQHCESCARILYWA